METKTCLKDITCTLKNDSLILNRDKGFLSLSTSRRDGGLRNVTSILISNYHEENTVVITHDQVTALITPYNGVYPFNLTVLINKKLDELILLELFQEVVERKITILNDSRVKINPNIDRDTITVACTGRGVLKSDQEKNEIYLMVKKCVHEALNELIKNFGYPLDIQGHIEDAGVTITDLVFAGMQLCVGVERTVELDIKLKNQLLKSLEDLNVVALIMAGIRLEEDFARHRIRGIDVDDDPAYLYSDEVLGMAVANQIAGTKAIFNFKRYDEEKPGIIGKLGPVLDDVFAGLVAGCMSKIFEE